MSSAIYFITYFAKAFGNAFAPWQPDFVVFIHTNDNRYYAVMQYNTDCHS